MCFGNYFLLTLYAHERRFNQDLSRLVMQMDGDLVLYDSNNKTLFLTKTKGKGEYFIVQDDANLIVYDKENNVQWERGRVLCKYIYFFRK